MAFRSATLFLDDLPGSESRLDRAIALASRFEAHLDVTVLLEEPPFNYVAGAELAIEAWSEQVSELRGRAVKIAEAAAAKISGEGLGTDSRADTAVIGGVSDIAALHARYTDVAIAAQPVPGSDGERLHNEVLDGALFGSGRPVLMMPEGGTETPDFSRVVLAWDAGRTASRAIHDALPVLVKAEAVSLAVIDPEGHGGRFGDEPGADIARQLARHGVKVTIDRLPAMGQGVAERLLTHATDMGAGLVVMGGYGHSKLREAVFGGVTRDMLRSTTLPVLMSH